MTAVLLVVLLFCAAIFAACSEDTQLGAGDFGSQLIIDTAPSSIMASWILVRPDGTEVMGEGSSRIEDVEDGEYWLLWEPLPGWDPPMDNPVQYSHYGGSVPRLDGQYRRLSGPVGNLDIDTEQLGTDVTWTLTGPEGFYTAGRGSRTFDGRRPGKYLLTWTISPQVGSAREASDRLHGTATLAVAGGETVQWPARNDPGTDSRGSILIDVEPDVIDAPWVMTSEHGAVFTGQGDSLFVGMPAGEYTLFWGAVPGYRSPSPNPVVRMLEPGDEAEFTAQEPA